MKRGRIFKRCAIKRRVSQELILRLMIQNIFKNTETNQKAERGECISKFRSASSISGFKLSDGQSKGSTFISVLKSDMYCRFYEKNYEMAYKLKHLLKILVYGIVMKYKCDEVMRKIVQ